MTDGLSRLTPGQLDCLRLVLRHMTSKDIARSLGISPHTVDMRLRTAMRTLGVTSRIEAARLIATGENGEVDVSVYQPLIYQIPDVAAAPVPVTLAAPAMTSGETYSQPQNPWSDPDIDPDAGGPPRSVDGHRYGGRRYATPLAKSLPWGRLNRLTPGARLAWVAAIAIGSALGFGAILAALEALKHLL